MQHKNFSITFCILTVFLYTSATGVSFAEKSDFATAVDFIKDKQFVEAFDIFERLAETHDSDAQFNIAILMRKGIGRPSNYADALKWAWLAELGGNDRASELCDELIDLMPEDRLEPVRNQVRAVLQERLDAGESVAILQMAEYHLSISAEPDYKNAYAFRSVAAALNITNAVELRDEIESELEASEVMEAQSIAAKLFFAIPWISERED